MYPNFSQSFTLSVLSLIVITFISVTPAQVRSRISAMKPAPRAVVAFQTRNPLHRAHVQVIREACKRVASYAGGIENVTLLLHPTVGPTRDGDVPANTRIHCYRAVIPTLEGQSVDHAHLVSEGSQTTAEGPCLKVEFGLLPLAMRMGGPREALLHAIIRQNFGASHFIVGRDHAGPGADLKGIPFYADNAAAELALKSEKQFKIRIVDSDEMVYCDDVGTFKPKCMAESDGNSIVSISGTKLRSMLRNDLEIPCWFSYPEVIELLRSMPLMRCQSERGFCVFFTGLSGSGKSTLASALNERMASFHPKILKRRSIQVLDGDECRTWLSNELGFTRSDRITNINRIGRVASLIVEAGGIVFCAAIAPHEEARSAVRSLVETVSPGGFIEVHVDAALSVCEQRDRKGLYAKSRNGKLPHFTGVDDVYQRPLHPDLRIDTAKCSVHSAIDQIVHEIERRGFISK
jgi:sulfate adenylyltransferase